MLFHRARYRILLLLVVVAMVICHLTSILVEQYTSYPTRNVGTITDSIKLVPTLPESVHSFLPQSPLDDELLKLQLPLIRLVKYLEFHMNRDFTSQHKIQTGRFKKKYENTDCKSN
jgi:hypothetical protein